MIVSDIPFQLRDGRGALLRSPREEDAAELLQFIIQATGETDFLLKCPEDFDGFTPEQEQIFLRGLIGSRNQLMLVCTVEGKIAGNCQISFLPNRKDRHRATLGIGLLREFWGQGIGTKMFEELIQTARAREGVRQLELDFIEGNVRARALYEKMGFRITGVKPDAICQKDGSYRNQYMMVKRL